MPYALSGSKNLLSYLLTHVPHCPPLFPLLTCSIRHPHDVRFTVAGAKPGMISILSPRQTLSRAGPVYNKCGPHKALK